MDTTKEGASTIEPTGYQRVPKWSQKRTQREGYQNASNEDAPTIHPIKNTLLPVSLSHVIISASTPIKDGTQFKTFLRTEL